MSDSYCAYLIRFQRADAEHRFRASIENAHTGEVIHFPNETALLLFLLRMLKLDQVPEINPDAQPVHTT